MVDRAAQAVGSTAKIQMPKSDSISSIKTYPTGVVRE